jgi:hypothetical protein
VNLGEQRVALGMEVHAYPAPFDATWLQKVIIGIEMAFMPICGVDAFLLSSAS